MKKITVTVFIALLCSVLSAEAQDNPINWGIKAGVNQSTLWDRLELDGRPGIEYHSKTGFYVGGMANLSLSEKWDVQPELLFSLRRTGIEVGGFIGPEVNGNRYRATRTESVIDLPVLFRYYGFGKIFFEAGPQLGYLLKSQEEVEENPFDSDEGGFESFDKFDAGVAAGLGVKINAHFSVNARYFHGLVERDNSVNSMVINLGLEYVF